MERYDLVSSGREFVTITSGEREEISVDTMSLGYDKYLKSDQTELTKCASGSS